MATFWATFVKTEIFLLKHLATLSKMFLRFADGSAGSLDIGDLLLGQKISDRAHHSAFIGWAESKKSQMKSLKFWRSEEEERKKKEKTQNSEQIANSCLENF